LKKAKRFFEYVTHNRERERRIKIHTILSTLHVKNETDLVEFVIAVENEHSQSKPREERDISAFSINII
jgi:hypothetical protein